MLWPRVQNDEVGDVPLFRYLILHQKTKSASPLFRYLILRQKTKSASTQRNQCYFSTWANPTKLWPTWCNCNTMHHTAAIPHPLKRHWLTSSTTSRGAKKFKQCSSISRGDLSQNYKWRGMWRLCQVLFYEINLMCKIELPARFWGLYVIIFMS